MSEADDASLAAERTEIAWGRTGLAIAACLAVVLRRVPAMSSGELAVVVLGTAVALGALVLVLGVRPGRTGLGHQTAVVRERLRRQAIVTSMVGVLCLVEVLPALLWAVAPPKKGFSSGEVWADRPNVRIRSAQCLLLATAFVAGAAGCAADRGVEQTSTPADVPVVTTTTSTTTTSTTSTTTVAPSTTAPPPVVAAAAPPVKPPASLPPMPGQVAAQRTDALEKVLGDIESALGAVDGAIGANEDEY